MTGYFIVYHTIQCSTSFSPPPNTSHSLALCWFTPVCLRLYLRNPRILAVVFSLSPPIYIRAGGLCFQYRMCALLPECCGVSLTNRCFGRCMIGIGWQRWGSSGVTGEDTHHANAFTCHTWRAVIFSRPCGSPAMCYCLLSFSLAAIVSGHCCVRGWAVSNHSTLLRLAR